MPNRTSTLRRLPDREEDGSADQPGPGWLPRSAVALHILQVVARRTEQLAAQARAAASSARARPVTVGKKRDWFTIFRHLMAKGVSMRDIARKCNRHLGTTKHWAAGCEPKDSDARVILSLYAKHCPEKYRDHAKEFEIRVGEDTAPGALV